MHERRRRTAPCRRRHGGAAAAAAGEVSAGRCQIGSCVRGARAGGCQIVAARRAGAEPCCRAAGARRARSSGCAASALSHRDHRASKRADKKSLAAAVGKAALCGRSAISSTSPPPPCRAAELTGVVRCSPGRLSRELLPERGLWAVGGGRKRERCERLLGVVGGVGASHRIASHRIAAAGILVGRCGSAKGSHTAAALCARADPACVCPAVRWGCRFLTGCRSVA